jgi:hypothetical protein
MLMVSPAAVALDAAGDVRVMGVQHDNIAQLMTRSSTQKNRIVRHAISTPPLHICKSSIPDFSYLWSLCRKIARRIENIS